MKAKSFIEWNAAKQDELYKGITDDNFTERAKVFWNYSLSARAFLLQPFKPELITQLFEGWVYFGEGRYNHLRSNVDITFPDKYMMNINFRKVTGEIIHHTEHYLPKTLDDFTIMMKYIGINSANLPSKLDWKSEIEKEYFA